MGSVTGIEWADKTWNPWLGCRKISDGCTNCYAEALERRWGRVFENVHRTSPSTFNAPLRWKEPARVFTCSMSDFFIAEADAWREEAWEVMRRTPHLTYQVLTKRPHRMLAWAQTHGWLPNAWAGVTVENQAMADIRLPLLAQVPASVRFASVEPMLGEVDLRRWISDRPQSLSWIIAGAESGPGHRPMDLHWLQSLAWDADFFGASLFVKQDSGPKPGQQGRIPDSLWALKQFPEAALRATEEQT